MSDFKSKGGVLGGREERYDGFEGEPKNIGGSLGSLKSSHQHKHDSALGSEHNTGAGGLGHSTERGLEHDHSHNHNTGLGNKGYGTGATGNTLDSRNETGGDYQRGLDHDNTTTTTKKPSLMDKLNPKVDANGDGKAGFMK